MRYSRSIFFWIMDEDKIKIVVVVNSDESGPS